VDDVSARMMVLEPELPLCGANALLVPLVFRSRSLGVLIAAEKVGRARFEAEDSRLLESFAATAAVAVHTATSVAEERLRHSIEASEQERRRWARELHDETLQGLGGLQMLLSSALRSGDEARVRAAVRGAVDQIGIEIANLRSLIVELRPPALDEIGLVPAIETLAQRVASSAGLTVETDIALALEDSRRLAPEVESTIYRLVQEALTNVTKHAEAGRVEIALLMDGDAIRVTVRDDGRGFDPGEPVEGFGLVGIRERVMLASGHVTIEAQVGRGTQISALVPVGPATELPAVGAG
jgi:two-component system, NarL family, sensor histidine kinase DevS